MERTEVYMLTNLRRDMNAAHDVDVVAEAMTGKNTDDLLKGAFLDDPDVAVIGAENDPAVAKLVASLPEFDEDAEAHKNLAKLTESLLETEI